MQPKSPKLIDQYSVFIAERSAECGTRGQSFDRQNSRCISRLAARGVTTLPDLIESLPILPPKLQQFGFWWLQATKPTRAEAVLLRMLHDDPAVRLSCAHILGMIEGRRSIREFLRIGRAQLGSSSPDVKWLEAVIHGLERADDPEAADVLVTIYERTDLPGWLRGEAGNALGWKPQLQDRRTRIFRRVWSAAQLGLDDSDIEVQFWSMFVIMHLATHYSANGKCSNRCLEPALPRLREIAEMDHRHAPGFWWPICEEAKDAIHLIETGRSLEPEAAERCLGNKERGEMSKRY